MPDKPTKARLGVYDAAYAYAIRCLKQNEVTPLNGLTCEDVASAYAMARSMRLTRIGSLWPWAEDNKLIPKGVSHVVWEQD